MNTGKLIDSRDIEVGRPRYLVNITNSLPTTESLPDIHRRGSLMVDHTDKGYDSNKDKLPNKILRLKDAFNYQTPSTSHSVPQQALTSTTFRSAGQWNDQLNKYDEEQKTR